MNQLLKKLLNIFKYVVVLSLSVFFMWYALKGINFNLLQAQLYQTNFYWLALSLVVALSGFLSRAYRWKMQLEPLGKKVTFTNTYHAMMIGYLANLVLPRMGEVFRCSVLKRSSDIPIQGSFGTVITERLIDMVMLLSLMGIAFLVEFDRLHTYFLGLLTDRYNSVQQNSALIYGLVGVVIAGILGLLIALLFFLNKLRQNKFYLKIEALVRGFLNGIFSIAKLKNKPVFIAHTLFVWFTYYLMGYLAFFALPATAGLSPMAAFAVLVIGSLGMSVPVQGGIGVFHLMVTNTLLLYGISKEAGMAFALLNHTSQTLMVVLLGGISFIISLARKNSGKSMVRVVTSPNEIHG
jgi:glycosyltransferase 2 family protein